MNLRGARDRNDPEINFIPLIDVLLVILIFLMVTTTYQRVAELQITLPEADAEQPKQRPKEINVGVDAQGRYGAFDWISIGTLVAASLIGWGLVVNTFSDDASWNNWQGYLLGQLGLGGKEGAWAFANLGVLAALALAFVVTLVARRSTVARQEAV
jgi:hypothetical protein